MHLLNKTSQVYIFPIQTPSLLFTFITRFYTGKFVVTGCETLGPVQFKYGRWHYINSNMCLKRIHQQRKIRKVYQRVPVA